MKFIAVYRDPKKKNLQRVEILLMLLALPVALIWGARSYTEWTNYQQAEALLVEGDQHLHAGQSEKAVASLEKAISLYPEFYGAWEALATTWHMKNHHDKELDAYQRAVEILPERGELHRELGAAYHENGDHKKELEHLTVALAILGKEEIFTLRLLDRATREAAGTYPTQTAKIPRASEAEHEGHGHGPGEGHDHAPGDGHDHATQPTPGGSAIPAPPTP